MRKIIAIVIIILGFVSGGLFISTGLKLNKTGKNLTDLRSVSGTSLAEAYYQEIGRYGIAYSQFCYAMGIGIATISLGFGSVLFSNERKE